MNQSDKSRSNRLNAGKSSGPKTPEGKASSSRNALSHGILSGIVRRLASMVRAHDGMSINRAANSLPAAPELMARYQSALDNDLYKAMRALREAQRFRRESLEAVAETDKP